MLPLTHLHLNHYTSAARDDNGDEGEVGTSMASDIAPCDGTERGAEDDIAEIVNIIV